VTVVTLPSEHSRDRGGSASGVDLSVSPLMTLSGHSHTSVPNTFELGSDSLAGLAGLYECRPLGALLIAGLDADQIGHFA
jgi:hypothetical protein